MLFFLYFIFIVIFASRITNEDNNIQNFYQYESLQHFYSNSAWPDAVYG